MTIANPTSNQQNIAAIYPLSPTQQGMLFHSLQNSEMYFQQMTCRLQGNLRIPQWEAAWQRVVDQHPILRTAFVWDKGNQPLQIVCKKVKLPWQHYDWQDQFTAKRFETFLQIDRLQGLLLNQAPLMRFTLIQTGADSYYLVWSYHHILIDGWSLSTIIQQVLACYQALCAQEQPLLAQARPYQDYIKWLQQQDVVKAQEFWRDRLRGFTDPTSLRIERSAIDLTQSAQYGEQHLSLTTQLTSQLQNFAKEYQLTLNTIIQGAWSLLLAQYSGTSDVLFGATVAGRPPALAGVESMVGLFINTLPVRVQLPVGGLVLDWLRSLQGQQVAQDNYAHTPLVDIQAESEIAHGLPLFSTIVVFENYPIHNSVTDQLQHLGITDIRSLEQTNYPLTLVVMPGAKLEFKISYDSRRYDAGDMERLLTHLQILLCQIVEQATASINQISLASLPLKQAAIHLPEQSTACIQQLFEQQVSLYPQAIALVYEAQQITYQELNQQANQLAHHLRDLGVGPDILVGIGLARSPELIVAILAVLKAGGAYVPLDPEYPPERLAFIMADAQVAVLLTRSDLSLPVSEIPVVEIDTNWPTAAPLHNPSLINRASDLAYVIYTSGSTGQPKGVLIPHSNVYRLFSETAHWFGFDRQDVWTLFHSCAFDFSVWEIWGALLHGGQLVVVPYWVSRSPQDFYELLQRHRVTILNQTPAAFQQLMAIEAQAPITNSLALRRVIFGGEALDIASLRPWFERHGDQQPQLVNMYGITETTVHVTYRPLSIADLDRSQGSVVGEPIPDLQLYVLDPAQRLQPIGVVGEIYVGGAGLARGYLNRPSLTAERFINHPFSEDPTLCLYRTGDLARRLPNGDLEYKGRIDQQVKVRGFRIELGEIEAAINTYPEIRQSAVIVRTDIASHQQIVAYIVAESTIISADLRFYLTSKLPEFMLPSAVIQLAALPLTTNGKLDRAALPAPQAPNNSSEIVQPRTDQEEKMTQIWQAVLGLEQVSIYDNFFELGGDSILSLQIVARANQAGMLLTPKQLFEQPTIATLTAVANTGIPIRATQTPITGSVPLTPIQHWLFGQKLTTPQHFNQSVLLTIPADFRPELLEQVLQHIYLHHDALRLSFSFTEKGWQQSNAPFTDRLHLQVVEVQDATTMPDLVAQVDRQLQANFHLHSGCLLQAALFQINHQPQQLLIVVHHLAIDGVSWRILLADLETAYQQQRRGQMIKLPAKSTEFQYWASRLTEYARSTAMTSELAYWQTVPAADIPVDLAQGINLVQSTQTIAQSLTTTETQALLQTVPAAYRTQINDLLLSAISLGLQDWLSSELLLINLEGHGRADLFPEVDLTRTIGWFTTIFPVCLRLDRQLAPVALLQSIKEQLRQVPQQGIGYGLLRYLHPDADLSMVPTPQISFNYLGQFDQTWDETAGFALHPEFQGFEQSPQERRPHLIDISGWIDAGQLQLAWTFSDQLHLPATITKLATATMQALRDLIDHCVNSEQGGCTPSDFPLARLSQTQLDRLGNSLPHSHWRNIADIYPLSPTQQGMLFHSLYQPGDGVYVEVLTCEIQGSFNPELFCQAWQQVADRHAVFRTAFWWEGQEQPQQVVYRQQSVSCDLDDWQALPPAQQQQKLADLLVAEQQQGFDLTQAPLMRLKLIQLAADSEASDSETSVGQNRYQLVWSHHHLLLDGWSVPVVLQEVLALTQGQVLTPAPEYRHYIGWLQQQNLAEAETFWRSQLQGFLAPVDLRIARPSAVKTGQDNASSREHYKLLTIAETKQLQNFAKEQQLTLNNLVQGAWSLLLAKYAGENDLVFGVTCSGRTPTLPGVETMVGLLINTLPLRVIVEDSPVVPWLKKLQDQQLQIEKYAYTPLVQIQGWSDVPNSLPLFESIVVVENYPVALESDESDLRISAVTALEQTNYPIVVTAIPGDTLELHISYDWQRFTSESIQMMLSHLHTLLMGLIANPDRSITAISLLTDADLATFLAPWQPTPYPDQQGIHQLFLTQAEQTPQAIAIKYLDRQITYAALASQAQGLAQDLQRQGLPPQGMVGLLIERSPEMIVGMLAILLAGGVYVPCDTSAPAERLALILADTQVSVVLTQSSLLDRLPPTMAQVICLDRLAERPIAADPGQFQLQPVAGNDPAYVIYTSGSTGIPKGVVVPHQAISRLVLATNYVQIQPSDCIAQAANSAFDATTFEVWAALLNGASVSIVPMPVLMSPPDFAAHLQQAQVTVMFLTPALFNQMARLVPTAFRDLRYLILGGEALEPQAVRTVLQAGAPEHLLNGYGPTESTTFATWHEVGEVDPTATNIPIGRPISNTYIYVLDQHQQPVPSGVPGELYIGGAGLALGYLHQPELTNSKFIPDPFQGTGRLYRSGDLVRSLPTGEIEYLGRIDQQVKIRGFRIELGEIAAVLDQHSAVQQSLVVMQQNDQGHKRLVAYVVTDISGSELTAFVQAKLPDYMVPAAFVNMNSLPLTTNGKVDQRSLPWPEWQSSHEFVAPSNVVESTLATIWSEVLGISEIGIQDNFFELGGDSILSLQIIARAHQAGIQLTAQQLFSHQSIQELAAVAGKIAPIQAPQGLVVGAVPLTPIQHWFFEQQLPQQHHFNQSVLLEVPAELSPDQLQTALNKVLHHHDALRMCFVSTPQGWRQEAGESVTLWPLQVIDLTDLTTAVQTAEISSRGQELQESFQLAAAPLAKAALFTLGHQQPARLLLIIHHLVVDGVSWRILVEDLQKACQEIDLPRKTSSFQDWARRLNSTALDRLPELDYWQSQLRLTELPLDYPAQPHSNSWATVEQVTVSLSAADTNLLLRQVPAVYHTQINDVLLTAVLQAFAPWTGQRSLAIELEGHGREELFADLDLSRTVGWFTAAFPLQLDLGEVNDLGAELKTIKEQLRGIPQRGIGFGMLRYLSPHGRQLAGVPVVGFNYLGQLNTESSGWQLAPEAVGREYGLAGLRSHLLDINGSIVAEELRLTWSYSNLLHRPSTIQELANRSISALKALILHCQSPEVGGFTPSDFPQVDMSQAELDDLLADID